MSLCFFWFECEVIRIFLCYCFLYLYIVFVLFIVLYYNYCIILKDTKYIPLSQDHCDAGCLFLSRPRGTTVISTYRAQDVHVLFI